MRIVIHDTIVTAPFILPHELGWTDLPVEIEARPNIQGSEIAPDQIAVIPSTEIAWLQETHQVIPDVAVVTTGEGTIAMRVPVRPDEITSTPIRLYETSGLAEILARATLQPFYGINATSWSTDDLADAQVVIVEGAAALHPPEAGFSEDLVRAWFILTGQPVVTHLLVVPKDLDRTMLAPVLSAFDTLRTVSHDRRRDLRKVLAERYDLDRDLLTRLFAAQRLSLEPDDRRALLMLLQRGNRGSNYPYVWDLTFLEAEVSGDVGED
jgi:predicted solute-binding protein